MSGTRAFVLLISATLMLLLAAMDGVLATGLSAVGLPSGVVARLEPVLATSLAVGAFVLIIVALYSAFRNNHTRERVGPYVDVLRPFAAEFGRAVSAGARGAYLTIAREGQVVELRLLVGSHLEVASASPARQSLAWFRAQDAPPPSTERWREVEESAHWRMTAELPAMARPLLTDPTLMEALDRMFKAPWTRSVTHVLGGMHIDADLPPPEHTLAYVRMCADLCFCLRRVNG